MKESLRRCQKRNVSQPQGTVAQTGDSFNTARYIMGTKGRSQFFSSSASNTMVHPNCILLYPYTATGSLVTARKKPNSSANTLHDLAPVWLPALYFPIFPSHPYSHLVKPLGAELLTFVSSITPVLLSSCQVLPQWTPDRSQTDAERRKPTWPPQGRPIVFCFDATPTSCKSFHHHSSHSRSQSFLTVWPRH